MNTSPDATLLLRFPELRQLCEIHIGIGRHNTWPTSLGSCTHARRNNDTGRLGGGHLCFVPWVTQKTDRSSICGLEGSNSRNWYFSAAPHQFSTQGIEYLSKLNNHFHALKAYLEPSFKALITLSVMSCLGFT